MAADMRAAVEHAISQGAVASLLVYETADGKVGTVTVPALFAIDRGLRALLTEAVEE